MDKTGDWLAHKYPPTTALRFEIAGSFDKNFPEHVQRTAISLGLVGWVRMEGSEAWGYIEGNPKACKRFLTNLAPPPTGNRIERVDHMDDMPRREHKRFEIQT